jgi:hypothetical protein
MDQKVENKEVNKLQEVASCRKSMCKIIISVKERVQKLMVLFHKLTVTERNRIGEDLTEAIEKTMRMILDVSRNLEIPIERPATRTLFLE